MVVYLHGRPYAAQRTFDPSTISWSVAGKPVELDWDSFEATAPGGYGNFTARAKPQRGVRAKMRQGDHVIGRKPEGDICYEGRLTHDPKYLDNVAYFDAMGPRSVVDQFSDRLPYQIWDASQWTELHSDPANFGGTSPKWQIAQKGNSLGVTTAAGTTFANGDNQGYYIWVQDHDISNVQFTQRNPNANANFDIRTRRSDDDFSAPTTVDTWSMSTADSTDRNSSIAAQASVAIIDWNCSSGTSPANLRFWVQGVRVGVITDQDVFSTSEVAEDVGQRCGYETRTQGATNAMPLDWNTSAADLLTYLGDIEDQTWLVMHSDRKRTYGKLHFRPWGHTTWVTSLDEWATDGGLQVQPLYNRVTTTYENPPGVQQQVRSSPENFGIRDPLRGQNSDYPDILQLEDPQANDGLARAVNAKALRKLTEPRLKGQLTVRFTSKGVPYDIWPGDVIQIGGFEPKMPPQRIASVTYNFDGTVGLSLGIDFNIAALVDKRITRHLKKRNRRRR